MRMHLIDYAVHYTWAGEEISREGKRLVYTYRGEMNNEPKELAKHLYIHICMYITYSDKIYIKYECMPRGENSQHFCPFKFSCQCLHFDFLKKRKYEQREVFTFFRQSVNLYKNRCSHFSSLYRFAFWKKIKDIIYLRKSKCEGVSPHVLTHS